jgi:hypothetical protein
MIVKRLLVILLLTALMVSPVQAEERLQGDPEAVAAVERMLERLGGREVWARTRTIHLVYEGWRTDPDEPIVERAWRDLTRPTERVEFDARSFKFTRVFTEDSGWVARDNDRRIMTPEELSSNQAFWRFDFYTMIRRFAVADAELRLSFQAPRRVVVTGADGADLGWWEIDGTGQPIRWGATDQGEVLEYVYLPVRKFGNINFPAGGAATDGFWRFQYLTVEVSPYPAKVSLSLPENPERVVTN